MPERRSYFAAAQVGGDVYVAGGMVGALRHVRAAARALRPARGPVDARARSARARRARRRAPPSAASLYVVGGQTSKGVSRRVYAFDVKTRRWTVRAPLPAPRYNAAAATLGGTLYVAGGVRQIDPLRTVFAYDARANRWRVDCAAAAAGADVRARAVPRRALGDRRLRHVPATQCARCGSTRLRTHRWRAGPRLRAPVAMLGAVAAGGRVYAVSEQVFESYAPGSRLEARPAALGAAPRARALRRGGPAVGDRRLRRARARRQPRRRVTSARLSKRLQSD